MISPTKFCSFRLALIIMASPFYWRNPPLKRGIPFRNQRKRKWSHHLMGPEVSTLDILVCFVLQTSFLVWDVGMVLFPPPPKKGLVPWKYKGPGKYEWSQNLRHYIIIYIYCNRKPCWTWWSSGCNWMQSKHGQFGGSFSWWVFAKDQKFSYSMPT